EKALRLRTEVLGERHPDTLISMNNYGSALSALGRTGEALPYYEKTLRLQTDVLGERHPDTLRSINNYGDALQALGRPAEALPFLEKSLRLSAEALDEHHPITIGFLNNYGVALQALGRPAEALPYFEKALRLQTEVLGERHPDTLISMNNYGSALEALGHLAETFHYYQKAVRLCIEVLGERHPKTLILLSNQAHFLHENAQYANALPLWEKFVLGAEHLRREAGRESVDTQRSVFAVYVESYRWYARTLQALHRTGEAFAVVEQTKARTLLDQMAATSALRAGVLSEAEARSLEEMSARLSALDGQIGQSAVVLRRETLKGERNALSRALFEEQARLRAANRRYAQLTEVALASVKDAPALIPAKGLFANYMVTHREEVFALTLNAQGEVRWYELGAIPGLEEGIEAQRLWLSGERDQYLIASWEENGSPRWRAVHQHARCDKNAEAQAQAQARAAGVSTLALRGAERLPASAGPTLSNCLPAQHTLYSSQAKLADAAGRERLLAYLRDKLLAPLSGVLRDKDTLILSPDGPLGLVAFDALPWGAGRLIETFEVSQIQSLSVLKLIHTRLQAYGSLAKSRPALLAMGNPNYENLATDPHAASPQRSAPAPSTRSPFERGERPSRGRAQLRWPNLPYTEAELASATALFSTQGAKSYRWNEASEQRLRALSNDGELEAYRYLLFPAHGYFDAQVPQDSALVLKGESDTQALDRDGYVSTGEWPALRLRSELTILSACETARGKTLTGEGLMGLAYALYVAGNANAVLTLWRIDDERTQRFITAFLRKLKDGQAPAQALARTKREFIQSKDRTDQAPYFWAPFVLYGR
ncbi:MAG: CHAT domain-containing tetratricopeptide repeat protein, partial [Burkholderiales bacterium]